MDYILELPPYSCVHLVFHVSCLNKVIDDMISLHIILRELNEERKIILNPKTIIETWIKHLHNRAIIENLVMEIHIFLFVFFVICFDFGIICNIISSSYYILYFDLFL
jgi:hypothetical protein